MLKTLRNILRVEAVLMLGLFAGFLLDWWDGRFLAYAWAGVMALFAIPAFMLIAKERAVNKNEVG